MTDDSVLLRCPACGIANRVAVRRLTEGPRCGKCKHILDFPKSATEVSEATFDKEVLKWPGVVLVVFWSPVCSVCVSILPMLQDLARKKAGAAKIVLINADKEWFFSNRFTIQSVPTFILYRHGVRVGEIKGAPPLPQLEEWIDDAIRDS